MKKEKLKRSDAFKASGPGRPANFETPEELFDACALHFQQCEEAEVSPTVNSLTLALGFTQRNALDYQAKRGAEFSNIISRAKLFIICEWERTGEKARSAQFAKFVLERMKGSGYAEDALEFSADRIRLKFGFGGDEEEGDDLEADLEGEDVGVEG